MSDIEKPDSPARSAKGRFVAGNAGGPGRPKGAVGAAAAALDQAAVEAHLELMRVVLDQARSGNLEATKMLWARIWPVRRGRPMAFDAPPIGTIDDVLPAKAAVTEAVMTGQITGREARPVLEAIDAQRDQISDDASRRCAVGIFDVMLGNRRDGSE